MVAWNAVTQAKHHAKNAGAWDIINGTLKSIISKQSCSKQAKYILSPPYSKRRWGIYFFISDKHCTTPTLPYPTHTFNGMRHPSSPNLFNVKYSQRFHQRPIIPFRRSPTRPDTFRPVPQRCYGNALTNQRTDFTRSFNLENQHQNAT